ncbi:MAG: phospholipase D-like domain-containing protein [Roseiflexaceae bacterium]
MPRKRTTTSSRSRAAQNRNPLVYLLLLILLLVLAYYNRDELGSIVPVPDIPQGNQNGGQSGGQTGQTGGNSAIQMFFTTPSLVYPDKRDQRTPSPLLQATVADIDAARRSVDVAVFDLDVPEFVDALLRAKERGAEVRVVLDSENLETPEVAEQAGRLENGGITVISDQREAFMHNKFIVIDNAITWMGSWNITENDTFRNNNNMIRFVNQQLSGFYSGEFEQMFDKRFGSRKQSNAPYPSLTIGSARVEVHFSPKDGVAEYVLQRLEAARSSIRFMTFSYTSDPIADAMLAKQQAGLLVQGVFEAQNASGTGSEFGKLKRGGIDVLEDGNCYILHHKTIIIDDRIVITGSYNFTGSAEESNDENLVIIDDAAIAQQYIAEFQRLYQRASAPRRCG